MNRLSKEKSPYLLQHKENPVDWYPWCEEAFKRAKKENKPIFLSIGYSTCHWCHVMNEESFMDNEVAKLLNDNFISIKVDREERPDIDAIYMEAAGILMGNGGWPLSVFMTSDKKPFFVGTYFPKESRFGLTGFVEVLNRVIDAWEERHEALVETANDVVKNMGNPNMKEENINDNTVSQCVVMLKSLFDSKNGGFGDYPKFPIVEQLLFLLRYWYINRDEYAIYMVEKTLDAMAKGGMYDHIGKGFFRYSVDAEWKIPHFEKMLYTNALLVIAYLEGFNSIGKPVYKKVAEDTLEYMKRELRNKEGGFYSAQDADSEGVEGKYHVFTKKEICEILGEKESADFRKFFFITEKGDFEDGNNVLYLSSVKSYEDNKEYINKAIEKIFNYREKRVKPFLDDKIITGWNGLVIVAFSMAGRILGNKEYIEIARQCSVFIEKNLVDKQGGLKALYRNGAFEHQAYSSDYAYYIWGLIELYQATYEIDYLKRAKELNDKLLQDFWDSMGKGIYLYSRELDNLITNPKEIYDGAMPSVNSVCIMNFIRLSRLTGDYELENKAHEILKAFGSRINKFPTEYTYALSAYLYAKTSKEVIIAEKDINSEIKDILNLLNKQYRPFTLSILYDEGNRKTQEVIPYIASYRAIDGKPTVYNCSNNICSKGEVENFEDYIQ